MWRPSWSIRLPHAAAILYALLAVVLVNLAYLAMEVSGQAACSWMLVAGRLVLTGVLLVPGAYLLGGGELLSLHRYSPVLAVLGSAALALVTAGHGRDLALGYLGFFSAVPLLYVLLFPERPFGALACSSTLAAASLPLVLHFDTAVDFNIQLFGTQALSAGVASYAALATRRARARETAGVVARTGAFKKLALSEARRVRSARLAAAGAVADKVAHDLNSPLAALRSNLRFALDEGATGQSAESDAALADAIACASRIEAVIGRLRSDALVVSHPATSCDLAAAARAALEEARPRLPCESRSRWTSQRPRRSPSRSAPSWSTPSPSCCWRRPKATAMGPCVSASGRPPAPSAWRCRAAGSPGHGSTTAWPWRRASSSRSGSAPRWTWTMPATARGSRWCFRSEAPLKPSLPSAATRARSGAAAWRQRDADGALAPTSATRP